MRSAKWVAVAGALVLATNAAAQTGAKGAGVYPNKPVRIIVPFSPGGATDIVTRIVAQKFTDVWGQTIVVDNRAGAGGNIGGELAAKANPDGYTLFMTSGSIVTANQHMYKKMPFNPEKDLVAITNVASGPQVVAVANAVPAKSVKELIALAKAKPGGVTFGSAGIGTQTHLAAENFLYTAKIDAVHVPYKGEGPAISDLVGGQIQMLTPNLAAAIGFVQQGRIRAVAVTSKARVPQLPNVPTVAETLPGFENLGWFGLMAPRGTPSSVIDKVHRDTAKILAEVEVRKRFDDLGMSPVGNAPAAFAKAIKDESARWAAVIRERKLTVN
ncbi:MAG: tripartite tricarboxylate transporter substrate binding protein [Betaproteobacteria bacterium]|nr:tripartite tricarboxylate transporter substrate binding protein [Betaproteobacteria bacterium]